MFNFVWREELRNFERILKCFKNKIYRFKKLIKVFNVKWVIDLYVEYMDNGKFYGRMWEIKSYKEVVDEI